MSVYVDDAVWPYKRMMMCHMIAIDTKEELLSMADKIGVDRRWLQKDTCPHFDICKSKRELALKKGAIYLTRNDFVRTMRQIDWEA